MAIIANLPGFERKSRYILLAKIIRAEYNERIFFRMVVIMDYNNFTPDNGYPYTGGYYYSPAPLPQPDTAAIHAGMQGLRRLSMTAGLCVLGFIGLQFAVFFALQLFGLADDFANNILFQNAFGSVYSVLCVFLPFFIVALFMDKKKRGETLLFGKPYSASLMLLALPVGFMLCMVGNYATNALIGLMDSVGVKLTSPEMAVPETALGMILFVVQIAFVPALIEEFALRGVIMQPLRKYGDRFAIVMSALVFALMHGNMVQAPFAFIAGIAIGYFVIATGSIWTGVLIHFANNIYSSLFSIAANNTDMNIDTPYAVIMTVAFVLGLACCVLFALDRNRYKLRKPEIPVGVGKRLLNYVFTVPMILALMAIFYITADYIKFGG